MLEFTPILTPISPISKTHAFCYFTQPCSCGSGSKDTQPKRQIQLSWADKHNQSAVGFQVRLCLEGSVIVV